MRLDSVALHRGYGSPREPGREHPGYVRRVSATSFVAQLNRDTHRFLLFFDSNRIMR
jgi:hypothetical protein